MRYCPTLVINASISSLDTTATELVNVVLRLMDSIVGSCGKFMGLWNDPLKASCSRSHMQFY